MSYFMPGPEDVFVYEKTGHACPECGSLLSLVTRSTMLVCENDHGPFYLV